MVRLVQGSGVSYYGDAAFVVLSNSIALYAPSGEVIKNIHFESILRVREIEFSGLTEDRDTSVGKVTIAPNERSGFEVVFKQTGNYEHSLRALTYFANTARDWIDTVDKAIDDWYQSKGKEGEIYKPKK